jgi:anti-sigma factor RsiW
MKDCIRFAPMIGSRPGELAPDESAALEKHLSSCDTCRAMAADAAATDGMVSAALLRAANARDFSTFADEVMARVDRAERPGLLGWIRRHRAAAAATLVPVMAALAVFVYVRVISGQGPQVAMMELSSEGEATTVLQTVDGPVVLLTEDTTDT